MPNEAKSGRLDVESLAAGLLWLSIRYFCSPSLSWRWRRLSRSRNSFVDRLQNERTGYTGNARDRSGRTSYVRFLSLFTIRCNSPPPASYETLERRESHASNKLEATKGVWYELDQYER